MEIGYFLVLHIVKPLPIAYLSSIYAINIEINSRNCMQIFEVSETKTTTATKQVEALKNM